MITTKLIIGFSALGTGAYCAIKSGLVTDQMVRLLNQKGHSFNPYFWTLGKSFEVTKAFKETFPESDLLLRRRRFALCVPVLMVLTLYCMGFRA